MTWITVVENKIQRSEGRIKYRRADEEYIEVEFTYPNLSEPLAYWIPVKYRRTGLNIPNDITKENKYLLDVYEELEPSKFQEWKKLQERYWIYDRFDADVTESFFNALLKDHTRWHCVNCDYPDEKNYSSRIQDIKESGYTIVTNTYITCRKCQQNSTHQMLIPIRRNGLNWDGREVMSNSLKKRIIKSLYNYDAFEGFKKSDNLIPNHKFPEARWDINTPSPNYDSMTDTELSEKFQLLTLQKVKEKNEACRQCVRYKRRGQIIGINFYYHGTEFWDPSIPEKGPNAEQGCIGCAWYDLQTWRHQLNRKLHEEEWKAWDAKLKKLLNQK